jgi:hypothetical protein
VFYPTVPLNFLREVCLRGKAEKYNVTSFGKKRMHNEPPRSVWKNFSFSTSSVSALHGCTELHGVFQLLKFKLHVKALAVKKTPAANST